MNPKEKAQRITELQTQKLALKPALEEAFQAKKDAFLAYNDLNFKWMNIRDQFEALDREEKLIFFSLPENKTVPTKRKMPKDRAKAIQENAKKAAMKALESLPKEIREQIMSNFK